MSTQRTGRVTFLHTALHCPWRRSVVLGTHRRALLSPSLVTHCHSSHLRTHRAHHRKHTSVARRHYARFGPRTLRTRCTPTAAAAAPPPCRGRAAERRADLPGRRAWAPGRAVAEGSRTEPNMCRHQLGRSRRATRLGAVRRGHGYTPCSQPGVTEGEGGVEGCGRATEWQGCIPLRDEIFSPAKILMQGKARGKARAQKQKGPW